MNIFTIKGCPKVANKLDNENGRVFVTVDLKDVPKGLPLNINPRRQNMKTAVARQIIQAVVERDPMFTYRNQGIKLVCDAIKIHGNTVDLIFDQEDGRGIFDGGHTYRAIVENVTEYYERGISVTMEILYGQTMISNAVQISASRNTTNAVKLVSVLNALGYFDKIKETIKAKPYATRICYSEYDEQPIKVELLLGLMMAVDTDHYGCGFTAPKSWPCDSYNSKRHAVERFRDFYPDEDSIYKKLIPLIPQLIDLYDYLQRNIPKMYNSIGGCYGARKVDRFDLTAKMTATFSGKPCGNYVPDCYIFPVLSALRFALKDNGKNLEWVIDPFEVLRTVGPQVVYDYLQDLTNYCQTRTGGRPGPNSGMIKEYMKRNPNWRAVYTNMVDLWKNYSIASF